MNQNCQKHDLLPGITLYQGDNKLVLPRIASDCVDLVLTSPPYDNLRTYDTTSGGAEFDLNFVICHLKRILKPGGVCVWVVADQTRDGSETGTSFRQALAFIEHSFLLWDTMIYKTNKPPQGKNRYHGVFEYMFVFSKGKPKTFNPIMEPCLYAGVGTSPKQRTKAGELTGKGRRVILSQKIKDNIWQYNTGSGHTEKLDHPATFPLQLALDHVASWTNPGDLVLDPFAGAGTTLLAAHKQGRDSLGIERSSVYCREAILRLTKQQGLFTTGVNQHVPLD